MQYRPPVPENLVHLALAHLDSNMLTSPDGKNIQVSLSAVAKLLADPSLMVAGYMKGSPRQEAILEAAEKALDGLAETYRRAMSGHTVPVKQSQEVLAQGEAALTLIRSEGHPPNPPPVAEGRK